MVYFSVGFNEPNALAVIVNDGSGDNHIFHLYVREKDPKAELWDGARSGTQAAVDVFNADEVGDLCWERGGVQPLIPEHYRPGTSNKSVKFCPRLSRALQKSTPTFLLSMDRGPPSTDTFTGLLSRRTS